MVGRTTSAAAWVQERSWPGCRAPGHCGAAAAQCARRQRQRRRRFLQLQQARARKRSARWQSRRPLLPRPDVQRQWPPTSREGARGQRVALPCPALPCPALPCPALPCPALPCPALPQSWVHLGVEPPHHLLLALHRPPALLQLCLQVGSLLRRGFCGGAGSSAACECQPVRMPSARRPLSCFRDRAPAIALPQRTGLGLQSFQLALQLSCTLCRLVGGACSAARVGLCAVCKC